MADKELADYISNSRKEGFERGDIRKKLIDSGWDPALVDEALGKAFSQEPVIPGPRGQEDPDEPGSGGPGKSMRLIGKFKMVLTHPNEFFDAVKDETGYEPPVKFYLLIAFIDFIFVNILLLVVMPSITGMPADLGPDYGLGLAASFILGSILSANITLLLSIIGTFIAAGFLHLFALMYGAKGGYQNTYKALVYAAAPSVLVWPAAMLVLVNIFAGIGALAVIVLWMLALEVKGLSRLHGISGLRAFAIILTPLLIGLVLVAVVVGALLFALGTFNPATYTARIPTGFTTLGSPVDWDLESSGDFSFVGSNRLSSDIEIEQVLIRMDSAEDTYAPPTPIAVSAGGTYTLSAPESGLNLGPRLAGSSYSMEMEITYNSGSLTHVDAGRVTGTVTS